MDETDFYVEKSSIDYICGNGLFTNIYIPKYTIIWREHQECSYYSLDELLSINSKDVAEHCFFSKYKKKFIYSNDNTIYINHSYDPTCVTIDGPIVQTVALRNIYPNEEIFEDYSIYDNNEPSKIVCKHYDIFTPVL
jgi:SET domain-containing protein